MATKCEVQGCTYLATSGETKCIQHKARAVTRSSNFEADGFDFVPMVDVPLKARYNEKATKLYAAIKTAQPGDALRVSMRKFEKSALMTAQRYALANGLRIGVRVSGDSGYLWKLTDGEIKATELRAEKMKNAWAKKGKKLQAVASR